MATFDLMGLFPEGTHIADCSNCGRLIGFFDEDVLDFTNDQVDIVIHGFICPLCESFLLLPNYEEEIGQNKENELE